jgi:large subunit ribosomal protein L5
MTTATAPRLKARYKSDVVAALSSQFGFKNRMQIPTLTKVIVNMGVGEAAKDSKLIEGAVRDLATITGQKPIVTKARKSIANFKLREGQPIGAHVTLRGDRMWEFMDRLLSISLPRIRDFRGRSNRTGRVPRNRTR